MSLIVSLVLLTLAVLPLPASAWNIPSHMLSAAITYQALLQENQQAIDKVKALLEDTSLLHVRARQHIWRNRAVDLLRGFQVDDPLDLQRRAGIPVLNSDQECYQKEELDASLCCHTGVVSFSLAV